MAFFLEKMVWGHGWNIEKNGIKSDILKNGIKSVYEGLKSWLKYQKQ